MGFIPFTAKELWNVNNLILPCWLLIAWNAKHRVTKAVNVLISFLLAILYASIVFDTIVNPPPGAPKIDFFSLEGVVSMFKNSSDLGILAAWIHYVIFDMWTAQWIATDFQNNIRYTLATKVYELISLFFTMMLGPVGLALYFIGKYTFLPPKKRKFY